MIHKNLKPAALTAIYKRNMNNIDVYISIKFNTATLCIICIVMFALHKSKIKNSGKSNEVLIISTKWNFLKLNI